MNFENLASFAFLADILFQVFKEHRAGLMVQSQYQMAYAFRDFVMSESFDRAFDTVGWLCEPELKAALASDRDGLKMAFVIYIATHAICIDADRE